MQYFSPEWATGLVDDEAVEAEYARFLDSLGEDSRARQLARSISLHDARVLGAALGEDGRLNLSLSGGDIEVGYWRMALSYSGPAVSNAAALAGAVRGQSEIWYAEFRVDKGRLAPGFLLMPRRRGARPQEFAIAFDQFDFCLSQAE